MSEERFHVVATKPAELTPALVQRCAEALGISTFDCRLRMTSALPRSLANFQSHDAAVDAARCLAELGLTVVAFAEALLPPAEPLVVRRWQWLDDELCATDRQGRVGQLACGDVSDIVIGRRTVVEVTSHIESEMRISTRGNVTSKAVVKQRKHKQLPAFMLILASDLRQPGLLFDADGLEFQCDPKLRGPSDAANLFSLAEGVIERCPNATVNRTLLDLRVDENQHKFHNRRIDIDASVSVAYVLTLLRRAAIQPDGLFSWCDNSIPS